MIRFWKTRVLVLALIILGLVVWVGLAVERDGRALVMDLLHEEGDASVLNGIRMSGVLFDRDARTPFAQGFEATGPGLRIEEAWQRRIKRTEYRNSTYFGLGKPLLTDRYEYRLQVKAQPGETMIQSILVTRNSETGGSQKAILEGAFGKGVLDSLNHMNLSTSAVLEDGDSTYILLPLDNRSDSWIYRIDAWGPDRDRVEPDDPQVEPLAVVPRTLGNRIAGFFLDGDTLMIVAAEDSRYASGTIESASVDERVLLYRFGTDGSPVDQAVLPTGEGTLADAACADGMLFVTMSRPAGGLESGTGNCEVCVFSLGAKPERWGEIPLDNLYIPVDTGSLESRDRVYRVIDGRLVFALSGKLIPAPLVGGMEWEYPDGLRVVDNGERPPDRQAIQLLVYEQSGEQAYRGLFDPGLSQDYQLPGECAYRRTERWLARLRLDKAGP